MSVSSKCVYCGADTCLELKGRNGRRSWEPQWPMGALHGAPKIWNEAGLGADDGYMCIGCLEKRLGRRLQSKDFTEARINELDSWNMAIVTSRKSCCRKTHPKTWIMDAISALKVRQMMRARIGFQSRTTLALDNLPVNQLTV